MTTDNRQVFRTAETEGELLSRPTKRQLSEIAPDLTRWNFSADDTRFIIISVDKFDMNIAVRFDLHTSNDTC
jgi:hypothetical protein